MLPHIVTSLQRTAPAVQLLHTARSAFRKVNPLALLCAAYVFTSGDAVKVWLELYVCRGCMHLPEVVVFLNKSGSHMNSGRHVLAGRWTKRLFRGLELAQH